MSDVVSEDEHELDDLQVEVAGLLLDHVYAPLLEDQHVRGVLPAPSGASAVRVALGDRGECAPSRLTAYEIPLGAGEELRTSHDVVWGTPYANAGLLRLVTGERGGESYGRFVADVSFMWMRPPRPPPVTGAAEPRPAKAPDDPDPPGPPGRSEIDPDLALENVHAAFAIGLRVPGVRYAHTWDNADPQGTFRMRLADGAGSWASVRCEGWESESAVRQAGPRRLWDEITAARLWWEGAGRPDLTRFGVTVGANGEQAIWLDDPGAL